MSAHNLASGMWPLLFRSRSRGRQFEGCFRTALIVSTQLRASIRQTIYCDLCQLRFLLCQLLVHQYDNSIYVLGCMSMHRYITVLIRACVYIQTHESRRRPQLQMDFVISQHTISGNEK